MLPREGLLGSITVLDEDGHGTVTASGAEFVNVNGVVHAARGDAPTTGAGTGAFWVQTGTPTLPKFTDSAGTTIDIGSGGGGETLAQTLAIGNVTGGNDLVLSVGDEITSPGDIILTPTGDIIFNGLTWPATDGSNGQILTTDGSGGLTFATPPGGLSAVNVTAEGVPNTDTITSNEVSGVVTVDLPGMSMFYDAVKYAHNSFDISLFDGYNHLFGSNIDTTGQGQYAPEPVTRNIIMGTNIFSGYANDSFIAGFDINALFGTERSVVISSNGSVTNYSGSVCIGCDQNINGGYDNSVVIGDSAGSAIDSSISNAVAVGYFACNNNSSSVNSGIFIGRDTGSDNTSTISGAIGIGYNALHGNSQTAEDSIAIGQSAMSSLGGVSDQNIAIGHLSCFGSRAQGSVVIGYQSMSSSTASINSIIMGYQAAQSASTTVTSSIALGYQVLRSSGTSTVTSSIILSNDFSISSNTALTNSTVIGTTGTTTWNGDNRHWFGPGATVPVDDFASFFGDLNINLDSSRVGVGTGSNDLTSYDSRMIVSSATVHANGTLNIENTNATAEQHPIMRMTTTNGGQVNVFVTNSTTPNFTSGVTQSGSLAIVANQGANSSIFQQIGTASTDWIRKDPTISQYTLVSSSRDLALTDMGKTLLSTSGADFTVLNSSSVNFPDGAVIWIASNSGAIDVIPDSGVTIRVPAGSSASVIENGQARLWKQTNNTWFLSGDLA